MLKFHHLGCLVDSIDDAVENYKGLFSVDNVSEKIYISTQGVYVCFVEIGDNTYIELVEPVGKDSIVLSFKKNGETYYHAGYLVQDIDKTIVQLLEKQYKLLNVFHSEAFGMKRCAFLYSPDLLLIELIEE